MQIINNTSSTIYYPKNILILPNMIKDKLLIQKILRYYHEDAEKLLNWILEFMTLKFMDLQQDLEQSHVRKIAAFHVHLAGHV